MTSLFKPTHSLLGSDPTKWQQKELWQEITAQTCSVSEELHDTSTASSVEEMTDSYAAPVSFWSALKIWLSFLGRSTLYFCLVASLIGGGLMGVYVLKIEMNLDRLLTVYIASSCVLWFFLTPVALYYSIKIRRPH
jgi:hypothetical protein